MQSQHQTVQRTTKNGRPIINGVTGLPVYNKPVELRIKAHLKLLYSGLNTHEAKWLSIQQTTRNILKLPVMAV